LAAAVPQRMQGLLRDKHYALNRAMRAFLSQAPARRVDRARVRFSFAEQRLCTAAAKRLLRANTTLQRQARCLHQNSPHGRLQRAAAVLDKAAARLEAGDPRALLARGYALIQIPGQTAFLRDPANVEPGTLLAIQLAAGKLAARVE
jgi:exodeoxyribonuclease VII large subunit